MIELNLKMVVWMQLASSFQDIPKDGRNAPEVEAAMTAITPLIVSVVQDNSTKVGKPKKKTGQHITVDTEKLATASFSEAHLELIAAALESAIREDADGTHSWWTVPAFRYVDAVLALHRLPVESVAA